MKVPSIFKTLFIPLFLILLLETTQLLMGMNYYPHDSAPVATLTSVALVFIILSALLAAISAIVHFACRVNFTQSRLCTLVEILSVTALALIYIPAAIVVFYKIYPGDHRPLLAYRVRGLPGSNPALCANTPHIF